MKKLILYSSALIISANVCLAQKGKPGCTSATTPSGNIVFFGIDYSLVRFSFIRESATYVIRTLPEINRLYIIEAEKYDVNKLMGKNVVKISLDYAQSVTDNLSTDHLILDEAYKISDDDVKALIARYPDSDDNGVGLVFVAEHMDKKNTYGSYYVTFFDLKTKEVLTTCRQTGKPRGIGMRNFWAASIYNLMKNWK